MERRALFPFYQFLQNILYVQNNLYGSMRGSYMWHIHEIFHNFLGEGVSGGGRGVRLSVSYLSDVLINVSLVGRARSQYLPDLLTNL